MLVEPPPDWAANKKSTQQTRRRGSDAAERFAAMMSMLSDIRTLGGDDDDDHDTDTDTDANGRPRHRYITCDHCRENSIAGARYKCGLVRSYFSLL